jgi:hypothetical protein
MDHLHYQFNMKVDSIIEVVLDKRANVLLLDAANYSHYRAGRPFNSQGGMAKVSPVHVGAPHAGRWHLVIDRGDRVGAVTATARLVT